MAAGDRIRVHHQGIIAAVRAAILLLPLFPLYITRFQILPEERALAARFGDDYAAYRARVRRWL